jgi:hypothetical protein
VRCSRYRKSGKRISGCRKRRAATKRLLVYARFRSMPWNVGKEPLAGERLVRSRSRNLHSTHAQMPSRDGTLSPRDDQV